MSNFFQEPSVITLRKKEISVSPLPVKHISKAAKLVAPLFSSFSGETVNPSVVLEHGDTVIELCALATDQSVDFIGDLNASELLALITLVVEQNSSFFFQSVMPQIQALMGTVTEAAQKAGKVGKAA